MSKDPFQELVDELTALRPQHRAYRPHQPRQGRGEKAEPDRDGSSPENGEGG